MTRIVQPAGSKGSLRWIQRAVNNRWPSLDNPILAKLSGAVRIDWRSPLQHDDFAEYRDGDFLDKVGLSYLRSELKEFWPERGPQWDALGLTDRGDVLLVEAKAHIAELCSPGTAAGAGSLERINDALVRCANKLEAKASRAAWTDHFYQLANRLAHLLFLRERGVSAYLVLVNFLNDKEMRGPATQEAWEAAYSVALHVMGLGKGHPLSKNVIHVFPDVTVGGHQGTA